MIKHTPNPPGFIKLSDRSTDDILSSSLTNFPEQLVLLYLGDGNYLSIASPQSEFDTSLLGLATFINSEEAIIFREDNNVIADLSRKSFEEAREIAIANPDVQALFLIFGKKITETHFVR
jgi:hypothetical protein